MAVLYHKRSTVYSIFQISTYFEFFNAKCADMTGYLQTWSHYLYCVSKYHHLTLKELLMERFHVQDFNIILKIFQAFYKYFNCKLIISKISIFAANCKIYCTYFI